MKSVELEKIRFRLIIKIMSVNIREQLHQQIDRLPDEVVEKIADFTVMIMNQSKDILEYRNWEDQDWRDFSLEQFFRDEEEVEYLLEEAQEIYLLNYEF